MTFLKLWAAILHPRYDLGILHSVAVQASNVALFGISIELS